MPTFNHPIVGTVRFRIVHPGKKGGPIELLDGFADNNLVSVHIPQLKGVPTFDENGPPFGRSKLYTCTPEAAVWNAGRIVLDRDPERWLRLEMFSSALTESWV